MFAFLQTMNIMSGSGRQEVIPLRKALSGLVFLIRQLVNRTYGGKHLVEASKPMDGRLRGCAQILIQMPMQVGNIFLMGESTKALIYLQALQLILQPYVMVQWGLTVTIMIIGVLKDLVPQDHAPHLDIMYCFPLRFIRELGMSPGFPLHGHRLSVNFKVPIFLHIASGMLVVNGLIG